MTDSKQNTAKLPSAFRKNVRSWRFWLKLTVVVLLSAILVVNLMTIVLSRLGLRRSLNYLPGTFVTIESGSMEPRLSEGDLIFVYKTPFSKLEVGDIITYLPVVDGEYETHGVIEIRDQSVITRGDANEKADIPIEEKEYCAKMIFSIPHGAAFWELLGQWWVMAILVALILIVCYGVPAFGFLYDLFTSRKRIKGNGRIGIARVLCSLALVSAVLTTPYFSWAKYKTDIGGSIEGNAESVYFDSGSLSEGGKDYYIQGWAGIEYPLSLNVSNWVDTLKYNEQEDITYTVTLEKITSAPTYDTAAYEEGKTLYVLSGGEYVLYEGDGTDDPMPDLYAKTDPGFNGDYTIGITDCDTPAPVVTTEEDGKKTVTSYTFSQNGDGETFTLASNKATSAKHPILIKTNQEPGSEDAPVPMNPKEKIQFRVKAETDPESMYHFVLTGQFTLEVAESSDFIGSVICEQKAGNSQAKFTLQTNQIDGAAYKKVVFSWQADKLLLQTQYSPVYDYVEQDSKLPADQKCYRENVDGVGSLTLNNMAARSNVDLYFLKLQENTRLLFDVQHDEEHDEYHVIFTTEEEIPAAD